MPKNIEKQFLQLKF